MVLPFRKLIFLSMHLDVGVFILQFQWLIQASVSDRRLRPGPPA